MLRELEKLKMEDADCRVTRVDDVHDENELLVSFAWEGRRVRVQRSTFNTFNVDGRELAPSKRWIYGIIRTKLFWAKR